VEPPKIQHARKRALFTLGALIVGIVVAHGQSTIGFGAQADSVVIFSVACGVLGVSILARRRFKSVLLAMGIVALGAGLFTIRVREPPTNRLDQIVERSTDSIANTRIPIELGGVVLDPIRTRVRSRRAGEPPMWATHRTSTRLGVERVQLSDAHGHRRWVSASGIVRVALPDSYSDRASGAPAIHAGDRIKLMGLYRITGHARNFGEPDWAVISAQRGRVGDVVVPDGSMIERIEPHDGIEAIWRTVRAIRGALHQRAMGTIGIAGTNEEIGSDRAMAAALLLGEREPSFGEVYETFQRVGVAHVLAISGFHLALVILLVSVLFRFFGDHARLEAGAVIVILVLGVLIVPMRPPIVRAGVIVIALLLAGSVGRRYDRLAVLAWVGVGLLIWRPMDVFSLGYQLSMGITGLLIVLSNRRRHAVLNRGTSTIPLVPSRHGVSWSFGHGALETMRINLACWVVAMPTIALHAGVVSLYAPAVSLVLIPMVMVLMVGGYVQIFVGLAMPRWSPHTLVVLDGLSSSVGTFVGWVDGLPYSSIRVGDMGWVWTVFATALLVLIVIGRVKVRAWKTLVAGGLVLGWGVAMAMLTMDRALIRIDMLDVGDGSCLIVQSDGKGLVWDCGSLDRRVGTMAARAARAVGIVQIDDAIVTHDNLDHFNGLVDLARGVGLKRVWVSRRMIDEPSGDWSAMRHQLEAMGVEIREIQMGDTLQLGHASIRCLWPDPSKLGGLADNDTSVVVRIDVSTADGHGGRTVVLDGDIESPAMEQIERVYPGLKADVLELPHHGSAKDGAFQYVQWLDPKVVIQSTGPRRLDDPRWDTLRDGRAWMTSADRGGIWVRIGDDGAIEQGWAVPR